MLNIGEYILQTKPGNLAASDSYGVYECIKQPNFKLLTPTWWCS